MPTRLEGLRTREVDLKERLKKIDTILDKENPGLVECQNQFVPNCRKMTRIGGYQSHDAFIRVTFANQREDRQRIVLCDRCALFLYQEESIHTEPARYFFENLEKERQGELRAVQQDIEYAEVKERLSKENVELLAGFKKKPVRQEGENEQQPHQSTLGEAARVKRVRKTEKKKVSPQNGAASAEPETEMEEVRVH